MGEGYPREVPSQGEKREKAAHQLGAAPTKNQTGEAELILLLKPQPTGEGHLQGVALPKERTG